MTERDFSLAPDPEPAPRHPTPPVPPLASPRGTPPRDPNAPRVRRSARPETPRRGKRALVIFLVANLIPIAVVAWYVSLGAEKQKELQDKIPSGVGGRALIAGIAFAVLLVLARLVLPAAKAAISGLTQALAWFRTQRKGKRVALYPAEAATSISWFLVQILFALDAVLILAAGAAFLMYVARIVKPELFPWLPG